MFGSSCPSEVGYFTAEDAYGKTVLRQAQRTDTHIYRILSARIVLDVTSFKSFTKQDDRIQGHERERLEMHYRQATDRLRDMNYLIPEAVGQSEDIDDVVNLLVNEDKRPK